jgi:hypothetical protein
MQRISWNSLMHANPNPMYFSDQNAKESHPSGAPQFVDIHICICLVLEQAVHLCLEHERAILLQENPTSINTKHTLNEYGHKMRYLSRKRPVS